MAPSRANRFVHAQGTQLVDGQGRPLLLRGVGLGGWLLPEGYMWKFPPQGDRPRKMEDAIRRWVGDVSARAFWEKYYENFITEADIRSIAESGFNSIRLPLHSRFLSGAENPGLTEDEAWELVDKVVGWCRQWGLLVVLDLHGAPGGQTGTNIDDSLDDQPRLFLESAFQDQTVELWRRLALRYRDEPTVAGYDLLNEPLPNWFNQHNPKVMPLYRRIVEAIRQVDPDHLIILEGAHWATDFSIFEALPDNVALEFHKYWNNPDTESLAPYLAARDRLQVPLFMGEGGENNVDWYAGAFRLFEDHGIGWNFWTWKKMQTTNSPWSVRRPDGWDELVASLENGTNLTPDRARRILSDFADKVMLQHCDENSDVVRALLGRAPTRLPAVFFGYRGPGVSYSLAQPVTSSVAFRRGDGPGLAFSVPGDRAPNFHHGAGESWTDQDWMQVILTAGSWVAYSFEPPTADLEVELTLVSEGGRVEVVVADQRLEQTAPRSPDKQTLTFVLRAPLGSASLRVKALGGTMRLEKLEFT